MDTARRELGFAEMILRKGKPKKKRAPVIKKSDVEEKLLFEIEMRDAAQRLLNACSNTQQRLEAAKTILTSNSRTLALMTALQKEHVKEVEDAHGLTDLKDKDEILKEEMLESVSLADVTISNIIIPLKWCRIDHNKYKTDCWKYQVFCLVRCGVQVLDSAALTKVDLLTENIVLNDTFLLKKLSPDFVIDFEFYYAHNEEPTKQKKSKKDQADIAPPLFAIAATATLSLAHCNLWQQKQSLKAAPLGLPAHITAPHCLPDMPPLPVLNFYRAHIDVQPEFTLRPIKEGFLDVQHMTGGMPHWVRAWCSLQGMYLKSWRQPEDQFVTLPTQTIEINEHMILDHVPRSSAQRPHSIHISYSKAPYTDYFLSTDTKEERILWEIVLHKAMINSSTWHPNKLSCSDNIGTSPSPLKSPPPKPPRPVTGPQFSYTPNSPCLPAYRAQYDAARRSKKLIDWTPKSKLRSKSAERKKTPACTTDSRSRAASCIKPNRRRSRSVELTPRGRAGAPACSVETPKRDRISDATYVSMHKYSRVPVQNEALQKPTRPAPRPPSLSNLPDSRGQTPSRQARPLSQINESYKAAVTKEVPSCGSKARLSATPPKRGARRSPRLLRLQQQQKLQVDLSQREKKKKAPTPHKCSPVKLNNRQKKSPAPAPQRRTPRQSDGGTNNMDSPNRSDLKNKEGLMNVYNDSEDDLSPSMKISNIEHVSGTPSSLTFDFENIIDEAFGSLFEGTATPSGEITPSFTPGSAPSFTPGSARRGNKVSRNTPLTSTMKDSSAPVPFAPPGDVTGIGPFSSRRAIKESFGLATPKESIVPPKQNITPIAEEEEEEEEQIGVQYQIGGEITDEELERIMGEKRGESLLEGYFDSSQSTINSEKENDTHLNVSDVSPIYSKPQKNRSAKRRSESPSGSPQKRQAGYQASPPKMVVQPAPLLKGRNAEDSPLSGRTRSPAKKSVKSPRRKTRESSLKNPTSPLKSSSPLKSYSPLKNPSPLKKSSPLKNSSPSKVCPQKPSRGSVKDNDSKKEATGRSKPRFQVVNGKLVPM